MQRSYRVRGQKVLIEDLEDILAVRMSAPHETPDQKPPRPSIFGKRAKLPLPAAEERAWKAARWHFVQPKPALREAFELGEPFPHADEIQRVAMNDLGQLRVLTDRLAVKAVPELSAPNAQELLQASDLKPLRALRFAPNLYEARALPGAHPLDALDHLNGRSDVVYAEPVLIEFIPARAPETGAPEPYSHAQWQIDSSVEAAWAAGSLGKDVRVAIVDNGFDPDHEDYGASVVDPGSGWFEKGEDGATFHCTKVGMPDSDHGSFCAGVVGAPHNGVGVSGVAPECELLLVSCLEDQLGDQVTLARAIAYAADPSLEGCEAQAADVIMCSLGPSGSTWELSSVLEDALKYAVEEGRGQLGAPVFWATTNAKVSVSYDEVVAHEATIAVGRSTKYVQQGNAAYGAELDFLGPGVDVYSTHSSDKYTKATGTSFGNAFAAGTAALVLSVEPGYTWKAVRELLRTTGVKAGNITYDASGFNTIYGYGILDPRAAVEYALANPPPGEVTIP